jgi:hypothetical protein
MFFALDPWSSAPVAYSPIRPKYQNFNIGHGSMDQKFHGDDEKRKESQFWDLTLDSNIKHDGILSIGNFMQMINNHFARFQLPGYLSKTKKCAPYFRGNTQFPIYLNFRLKSSMGENLFDL